MIITDTHVFFYSGKEIYSNWHHTVEQFNDPILDETFESTEQAFMAWKAHFFCDHETLLRILGEPDPRAAKELGRAVKGYNDKAWECVRLGLMTYVNLLKYQQNPEWAKQLKETGSRILIEASPYDKIWGVGLSVEEAAEFATREMTFDVWPGRNLLGEALMTVRSLL